MIKVILQFILTNFRVLMIMLFCKIIEMEWAMWGHIFVKGGSSVTRQDVEGGLRGLGLLEVVAGLALPDWPGHLGPSAACARG